MEKIFTRKIYDRIRRWKEDQPIPFSSPRLPTKHFHTVLSFENISKDIPSLARSNASRVILSHLHVLR